MTHNRIFIGAAAAVLVFTLLPLDTVAATKHPRLVNVESTKCGTCHGKLLRGATQIHPPVEDDCSSCHDVTVGEGGTTVELSTPEPELCIMCHDDKTAAAEGEMEAPHAAVMDSCLSCHDAHASDEENLLLAAPAELCSTCHDVDDLETIHGGQITRRTDCTSCHAPHGSANPSMLIAANRHAPFADGSCDACHRDPFAGRIRLRARGAKVCTACHGAMSDEAGDHGSVHTALIGDRARAGCLSCHDPHMSPNPTLLRDEGPGLCGACHNRVLTAANAATGHAPAAEDCLTCHAPHASPNRSLLTEPTPDLCVMCHDVDDPDLATTHLGAPMASLDCVACHTPHGAGNEHLLATNVHAAILDGCDTCHEGSYETIVEDGESSLCLACHDDIGEAAANAPFPHPAMEMARCVDCHNPHSSPQEHLIKEPGGGECTTCHEDQAAGENEVAHGVIEVIGCRACHEPHGGANEKLLRTTGSELCLGCHDSAAVQIPKDADTVELLGRFKVAAAVAATAAALQLSPDKEHGHPIQGHRVLGAPTEEELKRTETAFSGELTCLTCHDPHKGASRNLFRGGASSRFELCATCHKK